MMKLVALIGCATLLFAAGAHATVYTYKDANGKTVFSDQPPPGVTAKPVTVKPAATPPASANAAVNASGGVARPKADTGKEVDAQNARVKEENAKIDAQNAKVKQENCTRARGNLAVVQQGGRVKFVDKNGNVQYLDDKNRADQLRQAEQNVATWCK
ncbi:DUF4124 domain-containing protein [Crenobacter cavernae]|uniref:DUF4124 domain-containing protein n=2 Tax=Crenobacter cavernae TaxID=2290923 RepID=A0ABY0FI30_9NEIS|nr:DUF4124 domain-containing protein [Crenobacter cavernae]